MSEVIDNRAHRVRTLKTIIQHLHAGRAPEQVKDMLRQIVQQTDATELIAMEQELLAEGMPVEELRSMCDLHSQVTREVLVPLPASPVGLGHPVDTFRRENSALREVTAALRAIMAEVSALADDQAPEELLLRWRKSVNDLSDVDKHYQRKEHTLFSKLEKYGITGPSKVMWAKDDEIRGLLKNLYLSLRDSERSGRVWKLIAETEGAAVVEAVEEMIYKEENILLPLALNALTEEDWADIWASSPRYGWCLVEPREGWQPAKAVLPEALRLPATGSIQLPTGHLSFEQLTSLFATLPVDLTFVDSDDRVAFFSEGPNRVFSRSRAVIGRKVQNCHPSRSVDVVDRILHDFRSGEQSVAEFWIEFHGRFVYIRYFAVRNSAGDYLGTLEVTQDVSSIRALTGERRLLEYSNATA
jgi:DUF438 domain-containing protein